MKIKNIFELAKNDFKSKYAGSCLGILWSFLYPCVTVALYWVVFYVILKSSAIGDVPYILWLISALVPYLFLCDAVPSAAMSLRDYSYLVKKVRLGVWRLPLIRLMSAFFVHMIFVILLIVLSYLLGYMMNLALIRILCFMAAECVYLFVLSSCLAYISVFLKDISQAVGIFIQIGYWVTPLFWDFSSVSLWLRRVIIVLNPISYVTEGFRCSVLNLHSIKCEDTLLFWGVTFVLTSVAMFLHKRLKGRFADFV